MEAITFSTLPAEIHVSIARNCENHDLINLCLVSKLVNQRCLHVLYRYVDLQSGRGDDLSHWYHEIDDPSIEKERRREDEQLIEKQLQFVDTLIIHPQYGKHVRLLEKTVFVPPEIGKRWGLAMQSLTHVQHVDLDFPFVAGFPEKHFSTRLFQSVTSLRLVGHIQFSLAKSILNGISPATLNHLCLDLIPDIWIPGPQPRFLPQDSDENAQMIASAVVQGLLTPLTGRFTALRSLILRRLATRTLDDDVSWHIAAEEAAYGEWASFICSVKETVEKFIFEHVVDWRYDSPSRGLPPIFQILDERFQRLVLPTIASGNWPCLDMIELRGIRNSKGQGELAKELRAVLGENATIVVKEQPDSVQDYRLPYRWNL